MTVHLPPDDGETWAHERLIAADAEDDYGYPSLLFLDDLALISYHWRDGLHVARIGIGWFYQVQ
ncbi:MAG TPA: sialidase family protein [Candidatus Bathyarchaeia archaeon]|nr:sialidase family protein [Candidatus Bathyarchaeia archaeon]